MAGSGVRPCGNRRYVIVNTHVTWQATIECPFSFAPSRATRSKERAAAAAAAAARPQRWARVHPGCTLLQILSFEDHVVAGATPTLLLFPKDGQSHKDFLRDSGGRIFTLDP